MTKRPPIPAVRPATPPDTVSAPRARPGVSTAALALLLAVLVAAPLAQPAPAGAQDGAAEGDAAAEVSWGVAPTRQPGGGTPRPNFVLAAEPGETVDDSMTVTNLGSEALALGVYASDAFNTPDGDTDLLPRDEEPVELGAWLAPAVDSIDLAPGASTEVPFEIEVPADAAPGDHVAGLVASLVLDGGDGAVEVERRLGVRVYLRVGGPLRPELTFSSLETTYQRSWNPFAPGRMTVRYEVENTGNVRLRARRQVESSGAIGATAVAEAVDMPELLPGNRYELIQELTGVWPALDTDVEVTLEPYDPIAPAADRSPAPVVARTSITLWPIGVLAALASLAVVAILVVVANVANVRRRSDGRTHPKQSKIGLPNRN